VVKGGMCWCFFYFSFCWKQDLFLAFIFKLFFMSITAGNFKDGTTGWKVRELKATETIPAGFEIHFNNDGECVTDFVYTKEDAMLIAAAPDLLEACEIAFEELSHDSNEICREYFIKIKAAIDKARTGEFV
jgi:hypothetical protein